MTLVIDALLHAMIAIDPTQPGLRCSDVTDEEIKYCIVLSSALETLNDVR